MAGCWTESKAIASMGTMNRRKKHNPHKPQRSLKDLLKFLLIAGVLMFLVDHFVWQGERPYMAKIKSDYLREKLEEAKQGDMTPAPDLVLPEDGSEYFEAPEDMVSGKQSLLPDGIFQSPKPLVDIKRKNQMRAGDKPKIAIVIDDMGMNIKQSRAAIRLPEEITLAFLPYAETVKKMAQDATEDGHEIIMHAPMEPMDSKQNLGPMGLRTSMDYAAFTMEFEKMAESFEGYVGVNNHMGSRLTQSPESMGYLMDQLRQRKLFFLDSRTISSSVAADMADVYGVPYATRDVFLDHEETPEFVADALKKLEQTAKRKGYAIAIGHPKEVTMSALKKWVKTVDDKGFELVPLSDLIKGPQMRVTRRETLNEIAPAAGQMSNPKSTAPAQ